MFSKNVLGALVIFFMTTMAKAVSEIPPVPLREFRAAWVPSVGNIEWPSQRGLSTAEQKTELLAILDRAQLLKLNAIVLQVRPACDALYSSKIEPWSEYLTGQMGQAPKPFYDPLAFAVAEAHQRGLELHAWINPFRARVVAAKSSIAPNHVSKKYPGMIVAYGKYLWLDPGLKAAQDYSLSVIMDIVRRYDIDGLHMDDYFYPYVEKDETKKDEPKKNLMFRDDASYQKYQVGGGKMSRGDWRRENVNSFIARTYHSIKAQNPRVKFGVSPFGIWKPGHPSSTSMKSGNMYEEIYCDSLKWWTNGWMDYLSPQLYWAINPPDQSFTALLKWWAEKNAKGRNLWPGMNTANVGGKWKAQEIVEQINATRAQPGASGHVHWSMKSLMRNSGGISDELRALYQEPALIPAVPWLNNIVPGKPTVSVKRQGKDLKAQWNSAGEKPFLWVVQQRAGGKWKTKILPGEKTSLLFTANETGIDEIAISAISRTGISSAAAVFEFEK